MPREPMKRRVGGYNAPVDLQGMDPDMMKTFNGTQTPDYGLNIPGWMKQIGSTVSGMLGKKSAGRPAAPHPGPAAAPTTPAQADSIYNKYIK